MKIDRLTNFLRWLIGLRRKRASGNPVDLTLTVIIPAYNEARYIAATIKSVHAQTYPIERVLVVDDYSIDGTGEIARDMGAEVIRTAQNMGTKSRAVNWVLGQITSAVTVIVDADTTLDQRAIELVLQEMAGPEGAAIACGFVIPRRIRTIWERGRFIEYLHSIGLHKSAQDHIGILLVASGCFCAIKTDVFKRYGGFPERTMAEDMDLTWQMIFRGEKVALVPDALCYPVDPHDYSTYQKQVDRWLRSFLQNIIAYRLGLLKNKRLLLFVAWYLLEGLLAPAIFAAGILFAYWYGPRVLTILAFGVVSVSSVALWKGRHFGRAGLALASLPSYFLIRPVNHWLLWRAVWREWIARDHLCVWAKGHEQ